jgi:hypothetical protein
MRGMGCGSTALRTGLRECLKMSDAVPSKRVLGVFDAQLPITIVGGNQPALHVIGQFG